MTTSGNTFGRYTLSGRIAVGGMAEVFRGKFTGEKGFEKPVVIKKMLPQFASDEQMVRFFIDEARLSALLQHENIVCTYDFGELEGTYFIAMEDLQGQDLNNILRKAADTGNPPDSGNILWIASRLCNGLEYAHTLRDLSGRPLDIVHRDISPQNVYVTYDGNVKILDFGVAKTSMQTTRTRIGIAKGKMAYMSPEQLEAKAIDHRSDIFAVGILLYELATRSRMYSGDTTAEIFEQVMHAEFEPPENRNPVLDPNLAAIINKALQKDPADRFQSCREMQAAIEDCIFQLSLRPGSKTLSEYVISLFPESCSESQPKSSTEKDVSTHDICGPAFTTDKTESLYQKTVAADFDSGTMASGAGLRSAASSGSDRPPGLQPEVHTMSTPDPAKHRAAGLTAKAAASIAVILLAVSISIGFHFYRQASRSETAPESLQKAESGIGTNRLTTPEHDDTALYHKVPEADPDGEAAVAKEYEKIAGKYADLAEAAMKQSQYGRAKSFTTKGLEFKPGDERLLGVNRRIQQELLHKADSCILANRLTTPEDDCAAFYYSEVSTLFPDSEAGEKGFEKIAGRYADLAEGATMRFQYGHAGSLAAKGLGFKPGDERLLGVNRRIEQELLEKAENCIENNRLTTPEHDCAAFYYTEVSTLFPGSDAAEKGREKIAGKYADLAENAMTRSEYGRAGSLAAKGLEFKSGDRRLQGVNKRIKQELLQQAESCIEANRLITPKHDSALFYYNEVLKLFPDSDAAQKGFEKIVAKYADLAENAMRQYQFERARFLTAKGLEFKPDDERLLSLNRQLSTNKVGLFFKNIGSGIKNTID